MAKPRIGILHYSSSPIIGGVESVIDQQARLFYKMGYPVTVISGDGNAVALPKGVEYRRVSEMSTQGRDIVRITEGLKEGSVPDDFDEYSHIIESALLPVIEKLDVVFVHNIFTKHFNLPLTIALARLQQNDAKRRWIAWCHDFSWTSPHSRVFVHPGYPWDLLRTKIQGINYVTISARRRIDLAALFQCPVEDIRVIYNGVDPASTLGLTQEAEELSDRLELFSSSVIVLMPVRITQAKNIEFAMRLASEIRKSHNSLRLVVTGPPDPHEPKNMEYYQSLLDLRQRLQLEDQVRFVYQSGPQPNEPYSIEINTVGSLLRIADLVLIPSHREGFGLPVLEAGLAGIPVASTEIPAAVEIGQDDLMLFSLSEDSASLADRIMKWLDDMPTFHLRRRIRNNYTWAALFKDKIEPLITSAE